MVRKILSVVCVASIIASTTAGVLLHLRTRKGVNVRKQEEERENKTEEAVGNNTPSSPVSSEGGSIKHIVALETVKINTEKEVAGKADGREEAFSAPFSDPKSGGAFSGAFGGAFSPNAVLVHGVSAGNRKVKAGTSRRTPSVASSSAADSESPEKSPTPKEFRFGAVGGSDKKAMGGGNSVHEEVFNVPFGNPVAGGAFSAGTMRVHGGHGGRRKTGGRRGRGSFAATTTPSTAENRAGASFFGATSREKSPRGGQSANMVNRGEEKPDGLGETAALKPLFDTANGVAASGAGAAFFGKCSLEMSAGDKLSLSGNGMNEDGVKANGDDTAAVTTPLPAAPNSIAASGAGSSSLGTSFAPSIHGKKSGSGMKESDEKPNGSDKVPAATSSAPANGSAANSSMDVANPSPAPGRMCEDQK